MQLRASMQGLAAGLAAALLLMGCRGGGEELATPDLTPEPIEPAVTDDPIDEDPLEEPDDPEDAPIIFDEDAPAYPSLPPLAVDPDNDVPDGLEQLILDAFVAAYENEMSMYTSGQVDEEALSETHYGEGFDAVVDTLAYFAGRQAREFAPDTQLLSVEIIDFEVGAAIVRECVLTGELSGLYEIDGNEMLDPAPQGYFVRDRLMEAVQRPEESEPTYRVTQVGFAPSEGC